LYHFIINSKNYENAAGEFAAKLASAASEFDRRSKSAVQTYLAVPAYSIYFLSNRFPSLQILAQHLDDVGPGSTTGFLVPKIAKLSGASGSILNHSEHRIEHSQIRRLIDKLRELEMMSIVCAQDESEVESFAALSPDFIAIEPPELIGSGNAVSKARPGLITDSLAALKRGAKQKGKPVLLCGAGIVEAEDVTMATKLGAEGILVASGVIKADNWGAKIESLGSAFSAGQKTK
jgi:triosephosphate isomerase